MMWLVKFADNWADEMDLEGFTIMPSHEFTQWAKMIEEVAKKIDSGREFTWYFGTNEWLSYETGRDFKDCFNCEVIDKIQGDMLKGLLIGEFSKFGFFPSGFELQAFLDSESEDY